MTKEQFEAITQWQDETFGAGKSPLPKVEHLKQEVDELHIAIRDYMAASFSSVITVEEFNKKNNDVLMEFADCFILLYGAAKRAGLNYDHICKIIDTKMEINYNRKWGKADENGVVNHIKEPSRNCPKVKGKCQIAGYCNDCAMYISKECKGCSENLLAK